MQHIHEAADRGRDLVRHSLSFTTGGIRDTEEVVPARWLAGFVARARSTAGAHVRHARHATPARTLFDVFHHRLAPDDGTVPWRSVHSEPGAGVAFTVLIYTYSHAESLSRGQCARPNTADPS